MQSAFAASGRLAELLLLWAACFAAMLALGLRGAAPAGTTWNAGARSFHLPGSWAPMALILGVFLIKYTVGVQLALEPALARDAGFALAVTGLYGLLSGWIAARTLRVLRLQKSAAPLVAA